MTRQSCKGNKKPSMNITTMSPPLLFAFKGFSCSVPPTNSDNRKILAHKLQHLKRSLSSASDIISPLSKDSEDICRVRQQEEQLFDYKKDLADLRGDLFSLDLEVMVLHTSLEKLLFDCSLHVKELLQAHSHESTPSLAAHSDSKGVKIPKFDVPTFHGSILSWKRFWEQFCISVHDRSSLSESEKLVYLQQAPKDGPAGHVIDGLTRSGEHYAEAVSCPMIVPALFIRCMSD